MAKRHLIIFVKNVELGKVKTRLAKDIGDENALAIYKELLIHTYNVSKSVETERRVFYSDYVQNMDLFDERLFEKYVQVNNPDLGERMYEAFKLSFGEWAEQVLIIGSDCYELTHEIINEAYDALNRADFVLGPAKDGGYYLLGMNKLHKDVFKGKEWSGENVLLDTIIDIENSKHTLELLPTLSDIDVVGDLPDELLKKI